MNYRGQAKLYYLYMMSDGEISDSEMKLFDKICEELHIDEEDKKKIELQCSEIIKEKKRTCIEVIEENAAGSYISDTFDIDLNKYGSDEDIAKIIWNLVNLGYADYHFTIDERKVVEYLRAYWNLPDSIYQEMIDIAETCLALEKHKLWIKGLPDSDYKLKKIKQVNKDLEQVQETIFTTISEIAY